MVPFWKQDYIIRIRNAAINENKVRMHVPDEWILTADELYGLDVHSYSEIYTIAEHLYTEAQAEEALKA
jgi:hypothetical protein